MSCVCCGRQFTESGECPFCKFPVYEIVGDDASRSEKQISGFADLHRAEYLKDLEIGVIVYDWKDQDGVVVEDHHFGDSLMADVQYLPDKLARIPDLKTVPVQIVIKKGNVEKVFKVELPNLMEAELQQIGVSLEPLLNITILLKNDSNQSSSKPVSIAIG